MFSPSIKEVKEIAKNEEYKRIPISYELFSDIATPIEVLRILKGISNHCYMLESIEDAEKWGRYSFLGFDPLLEFTCQDGVVKIKGDADFNEFNDDLVTIETDNPSVIIKDLILKNKSPKLDYLPPFTGGFVGYFAYDYIKYSEPSLNLDAENQDQFKDIDLMLFDKVIAFDNFRQKIIIIFFHVKNTAIWLKRPRIILKREISFKSYCQTESKQKFQEACLILIEY